MPHWSMQDPDLQGPWSATMPRLEGCTPYSDDHAACWGWQDAGAISAGPRMISRTTATPDAMPYSVLPTVFDYCTPVIRGKTTTSILPCSCTPPLLVTIKGGGGLLLRGTLAIITYVHDHCHTLSTTEHSPQPTPLLAEIVPPTTSTPGAR